MEVPFLKNIKLEYLTNGGIICLAKCLGCNYKEPLIRTNRYVINYSDHQEEFLEEQEKINKEYDIEYTKYMDNVVEWLYEHDYLEDREDD
jgi:hypothetical protein